jgi:mono/diheme cytochrome c family protein
MLRTARLCLAASLLALAPCATALGEPVEEGRLLAEKHCAHCHAIGPEGKSRVRQATPFRDFSLKWPADKLEKTVFKRMVMGAHPRVPQSVGEPAEFAKLIGYIRSLSVVPGKQALDGRGALSGIGQ